MGYTTSFQGEFAVTPALKVKHFNYLKAFSETRRMKRDHDKAALLSDKVRAKVGLQVGIDGAYFVGNTGNFGQDHDDSISDYNSPPFGQPGLWCQWTPSEDGEAIVWDEGEKFYDYVEWLKYLIENFLSPWGYKLNGEVMWQGEEQGDVGKIVVKDNVVTTKSARLVWEDAE
jgi:hypothetical protein